MVIVESASVLSQRIQLASERTECAAINGVAVSSTVDIRPRSMNGRVDHVGGSVEETAFASIDDLAGVVDQDKIRLVDERKCHAKWVHPEAILCRYISLTTLTYFSPCSIFTHGIHRVTESNMTRNTLIKAIFAKDAECSRETSFQVLSLLIFVFELWRSTNEWCQVRYLW